MNAERKRKRMRFMERMHQSTFESNTVYTLTRWSPIVNTDDENGKVLRLPPIEM